jgi:hypothetical protein
MKKTSKRILAIFLAALMTLSVSAAAGAAAPGKAIAAPRASSAPALTSQATATLTIDTPPSNDYVLENRSPDFSGLVVTLTSGSFSKQLRGEDDYISELYAAGVSLHINVYLYTHNEATGTVEEIPLVAGTDVTLVLQVEYYDRNTGEVYFAETPCPFHITSIMTAEMAAGATALTLDTAATATLTQAEPFVVFKFIPETTGWYNFASTGTGYWSGDGLIGVDPLAYLYDDALLVIDYNDWGGIDDPNFNIQSAYLEAGKTYYLAAYNSRGGTVGSYPVTVTRSVLKVLPSLSVGVTDRFSIDEFLAEGNTFAWDLLTISGAESIFDGEQAIAAGTATVTITAPDGSTGTCQLTVTPRTLVVSNKTPNLDYHSLLCWDELLEGTTWDLWQLNIDYDPAFFGTEWYYGIYAIGATKRGDTTITITAPDGTSATVKVHIDYSPAQWACVILLGGWAWMPYTDYGPFNSSSILNAICKIFPTVYWF